MSAFGSLDAETAGTPAPVEVTTEKPTQTVAKSPSTPDLNPPGHAVATCSAGAELLFRGRSEDPGMTDTGSLSTEGAAEVAVCRFASGELEYHGVNVETGDDIRLAACQSAFNGWTATDAGFKYVVTDRSADDMGSPGIVSRSRPDGGTTIWLLWSDIARDPELQAKPATRCTEADPVSSAPTLFSSPTGNITCSMTEESVRCDIASHDWSLTPPSHDACDLDFGYAFSLTYAVAEPLCAGDTIQGGDARELKYGDSVVVGPFSCLSEASGMTCTSEAGAKIFLSKQDIQMNNAGAEQWLGPDDQPGE